MRQPSKMFIFNVVCLSILVSIYSNVEAAASSHGVGFDKSVHHSADDNIKRSCAEILKNNARAQSGIYLIQPVGFDHPLEALCDMTTNGGGWTNILRRVNGRIEFYRDWRHYVHGFGFLDLEFFMGLQFLKAIQDSQGSEESTLELLIQIQDREGYIRSANYKNFSIGEEPQAYPLLTAEDFSGDAGDSLSRHVGSKFSTYDYDQDGSDGVNCAEKYQGAWWYNGKFTYCYASQLTGKFLNIHLPVEYRGQGVHWTEFRGIEYCHHKVRMMVRPSEN